MVNSFNHNSNMKNNLSGFKPISEADKKNKIAGARGVSTATKLWNAGVLFSLTVGAVTKLIDTVANLVTSFTNNNESNDNHNSTNKPHLRNSFSKDSGVAESIRLSKNPGWSYVNVDI